MRKRVLDGSDVYGMLKPREIREVLRGKIDPEIGKILVRLCEDNRETRNQVDQLAKMMDQWSDILNAMMNISSAMKITWEKRFGPIKPGDEKMDNASTRIKSVAPEEGG